MKEPRKEIFQKLKSMAKEAGVKIKIILAEQKAAIPNEAIAVIDPMQIFANVGGIVKGKPVLNGNDLTDNQISEHRIEAMIYFLDSTDGKQDSSLDFFHIMHALQKGATFTPDSDTGISVLNAQSVSVNTEIEGAEYRRQYALRLELLFSILWRANSAPIESMSLQAEIANGDKTLEVDLDSQKITGEIT